MCFSYVLVQMGLVSKALVASLVEALVWLIFIVKVHMSLKTSLFRELFIANLTFKRLDTFVGPYVNLKSLNF